jgi:hypothetical protein
MLFNELFNSNPEPLAEGVLDNSGQEHSPVASAIIRRILLQRTDLLSKYGPVKVGAAVDDVADFVGDTDEIGSSDVSGWVRQVEQMLGNMSEGDDNPENQIDEIGDTPAGLDKLKQYRAAVGRQFHKTGEYDIRNPDRKPNPFNAKDKEQFPANKQYTRIAGAARAKKIEKSKEPGMAEAGYRRDAYQRDYDNSVAGMGKRDSYAYSQDGGGNDERHDLDPTEWYIVKDGKMFKATVYPNQVQSAMSQGFSPSREEAKARADQQGVMEYDKYPNKNSEPKWWENPKGLKKELDSDNLSPSNHKTQLSPIQRTRQEFPLKLKEKQGMAEGDISQIEKDIAAAPVEPIANMEGSNQKIGNMDADAFDSAMARLKKLAGAGPMKTVWDPARRQYRNMPTAVQPPQQPKK